MDIGNGYSMCGWGIPLNERGGGGGGGGGTSINQIHQQQVVASEWMCLEGQFERLDPPPER